jgi:hypothetical protein
MNRLSLWNALRAQVLLCPALFITIAVAQSANVFAQPAKPVISLDPSEPPNVASVAPVKGEASFANAPANFHSFPSAGVGEDTYAERLTLHFGASTKLTRIESTKDFKVEESSSCAEGRSYSAGESCILLVHFMPQGPGRRLGRLTITHTASAEPFALGLGGNGFAPVVSFNPASISTLPGSYPSSKGLLTSAQNLTVDGGDSLYIADTGNNAIRYMDSSGNITNLATGLSGPLGIAVDNFGEVYFDEPSANAMFEIYDYGPLVQINGTGTVGCPATTPCNLNSEGLGSPGTMSNDSYNHLFFVDSHSGAAMATVQPLPAKLIFLYDPFPFQTNPSSPIVADASDNIYSLWSNGSVCEIARASLYDAENSNVIFTKIVGGHTCGFSGDGGQAGNAEIGAKVGQMAFDLAGNFYFSDTSNQRVRRIDATTGIINTIAGNGSAGYTGDGGQATSATLSTPTGVGVDSQGQVYIISGAAATGTAQVVRKLGPNGFLNFGGQLKGTTSSAHLVTVANTGNSALTLTNAVFTGANPGDFSVDPTTTSCLLSAGATLYSGQSCKIGFLLKPSAGGLRQANFVLLDNTVTNSNTVQLLGTGALPAPVFTITSPAVSTSVAAGTAVKFAVSVTSTTSPAPTGKVTMLLDGATISGSPATLTSGAASLSVVTSVTGTHKLSATYNGDTNYAAAGPITRAYTVTAAASKTKLTSSANPAARCNPVDFSVTVAGTSGAEPTGKVELKKGGIVLATAPLIKAAAKLSTSALPAGTNVLTASYEGDARNDPSTSPAFKQVILSTGVGCSSSRPHPGLGPAIPLVLLAP